MKWIQIKKDHHKYKKIDKRERGRWKKRKRTKDEEGAYKLKCTYVPSCHLFCCNSALRNRVYSATSGRSPMRTYLEEIVYK